MPGRDSRGIPFGFTAEAGSNREDQSHEICAEWDGHCGRPGYCCASLGSANDAIAQRAIRYIGADGIDGVAYAEPPGKGAPSSRDAGALAPATTWLTNSTPRNLHATPAAGWAARQRQHMVAQETPTVSRTRSMAFPGQANHLHPAQPPKRPRRAGGTPITGAASLYTQNRRLWVRLRERGAKRQAMPHTTGIIPE